MAMEAPTTTTAITPGTTAGEFTFSTPVSFINLDNDSTGDNAYIKLLVSGTELTDEGAASVTEYDLRLADGESYVGHVSGLGFPQGARVEKVSVWLPSGTAANFKLFGNEVAG